MKKNRPDRTPQSAGSGPEPQAPPKRSFLKWLWTVLGIVALIEMAGLALSFFFPVKKENRETGRETIIPAGSVDQYTPGTVTPFTRGFFYLACLEDGGFLACSSRCTHLGCTLPWDQDRNRFICPCHASSFDIRGQVLTAPALRPLDRYELRIENREIFVDVGRKIRRRKFDPQEVAYPDKIEVREGERS